MKAFESIDEYLAELDRHLQEILKAERERISRDIMQKFYESVHEKIRMGTSDREAVKEALKEL